MHLYFCLLSTVKVSAPPFYAASEDNACVEWRRLHSIFNLARGRQATLFVYLLSAVKDTNRCKWLQRSPLAYQHKWRHVHSVSRMWGGLKML